MQTPKAHPEIKFVDALIAALKDASPVMMGLMFLGFGYGVYTTGCGFSRWWPAFMAATIYAGSVEFIVVGLLLSTFNPLYAFIITLFVNGRHFFYGISMLEKYQSLGWKKLFLVSWMTDEAFSLNYIAKPRIGIRPDWYMMSVTLLLFCSWVGGSTLGGVVGTSGFSNIKGIEFVMPALFIVIFVSQWQKEESHGSSLLGVAVSICCLLLFGETYFLLPTLILITAAFSLRWLIYKNKKELI